MYKIYYFLSLFATMLLYSCTEPEEEHSDVEQQLKAHSTTTETPIYIENFNFEYSGKIDGKYDIVMQLRLFDNQLAGSYYYTKYNQNIELKGGFNHEDNSFKLEEFTENVKTGDFSGEMANDYSISGFWTAHSDAPGRVESFAFEAQKTNEYFVWYRTDLPFHPYQVEQLFSLGDTKDEVDISKEVELPENYKMYEDSPKGYSIDYGDDFYMRTPFFEYECFGQDGNLFIITTSESGGGTGVFTGAAVLQLDENKLIIRETIAAGDRCNGGVWGGYYQDRKFHFSQNTTQAALFAHSSIKSYPEDFYPEDCAICCIGEIFEFYDVDKKRRKFEYFEPQAYQDHLPENPSERVVFDHLLFNYSKKFQNRMNQEAIDQFFEDYFTQISTMTFQ